MLERLDATHPVAVLTRDAGSRDVVAERTTLPVLFAPGFNDLAAQYDALDAKVVLYCNNSALNFNSLLDGRMLHVHINHGESDKHSMVSNNAKAYDRVFVAGEAAVQRHRAALMEARRVASGARRPAAAWTCAPLPCCRPAIVVPCCTRRPGRATRTTTATPRST
ncbi:hypothetical protein G5V59_03965 [Nocardioides sp. W3-2-3]|uniref:hypothetical protein n=1 Tax=Nocardioides convexus TaxID=2712224 RepID=UPI0024185279|nr:hypothetical protein [Nocardioides convexus]NGZ99778.1 hypothetical protein [Nocardioides convexus]